MALQMFQDDDNQTSFSRISVFIMIIFYLAWASFLVYTTKIIPDVPLQFVALATVLYSVNKISTKFGTNGKK